MGQYEPNDEEADWPSDEERDDELAVSDLNAVKPLLPSMCMYLV